MPSVLALQRHAATASTGRLLCCPPVFEAASHGANSPHKTLPFIESGRSFTQPEPASTTTATCETPTLADHILNRLEELIFEAEQKTKPLELDPYRSQLFELFVMAEGAGYTKEGSDPDLSADGLCRLLGARWGLAAAAREAMVQQSKMPQEQLAKMRLLWSVMRMWMEWGYAWERWPEFHGHTTGQPKASDN